MQFRWIGILAFLLFSPISTIAQGLNLEDIWLSGKYSSQGVRGFSAMNDGESYVQIDADKERSLLEINRYSINEGTRLETLVSNAELIDTDGTRLNIRYFSFSDDENRVMFLTNI